MVILNSLIALTILNSSAELGSLGFISGMTEVTDKAGLKSAKIGRVAKSISPGSILKSLLND